MAQTFFSRVCTLLTVCLIPLAVYAENYDTWSDSTYDFSSVHTLYIDTLDTSSLQTDTPLKVYRLKKDFQKKAAALKGAAVVTPALEPPAPAAVRQEAAKKETAKKEKPISQSVEIKHAVTSDPAADMPSENTAAVSAETAEAALPEKSTATVSPTPSPAPVVIPQAAIDAKADAYVTAQLLTYHVGTGLIPAHTEWNSYSVRDVYYDRDGHPHWFYHDVSYPVYVPDAYVPMATVRVRFAVYDVKTGKLVSYSEDMRTRGSSDDLRGVYQRILDRFFKNLKKTLNG